MAKNKTGKKKNKPSHKRYNETKQYIINKMRRIRRNNGYRGDEAVEEWERKHGKAK